MSLNRILRESLASPRYVISAAIKDPNKASVSFEPNLWKYLRSHSDDDDWWLLRRELMAFELFVNLARAVHEPGE